MNESAVVVQDNLRGSRVATQPRLTPSEFATLRAYACGLTTAEVAADRKVARQTVRNHLTTIYRKLDVGGATQAFITMGWLKVPK